MSEKTLKTRIQNKRGTTAEWATGTAPNFVPLDGELIVYKDVNKIKIGNGTSKVGDLPFVAAGANGIDALTGLDIGSAGNCTIAGNDISFDITADFKIDGDFSSVDGSMILPIKSGNGIAISSSTDKSYFEIGVGDTIKVAENQELAIIDVSTVTDYMRFGNSKIDLNGNGDTWFTINGNSAIDNTSKTVGSNINTEFVIGDNGEITSWVPINPYYIINGVPTSATLGTLPDDTSWTYLKTHPEKLRLLFNKEFYQLSDDQHTTGTLVFSHVGYEGSQLIIKTITITISTRVWVLTTIKPVGEPYHLEMVGTAVPVSADEFAKLLADEDSYILWKATSSATVQYKMRRNRTSTDDLTYSTTDSNVMLSLAITSGQKPILYTTYAQSTTQKTTTLSSSSTDNQYPSAKAVVSYVGDQVKVKDVTLDGESIVNSQGIVELHPTVMTDGYVPVWNNTTKVFDDGIAKSNIVTLDTRQTITGGKIFNGGISSFTDGAYEGLLECYTTSSSGSEIGFFSIVTTRIGDTDSKAEMMIGSTSAECSIRLNGEYGTSGQVLTSQGEGKTPVWTTIPTPTNVVTIDGSQTITGAKYFSGGLVLSNPLRVGSSLTSASAGTSGQVLTSRGSSGTPIWRTPSTLTITVNGQTYTFDGSSDVTIDIPTGTGAVTHNDVY